MKRYIRAMIRDISDEDEEVRYAIAGNLETAPEELIKLANDPSDSVRWRVALNDNTPIEALKELSKSDNHYILCAVFCNPNTPIDWIYGLPTDKLMTLAHNRNTPPKILKALLKYDYEISSIAERRLREWGEL